MNSAYHPPDMSQRIPGPAYSSSVPPPPIHTYQQHQHPPPPLPPPSQHHHSSHPPLPPPPSAPHPHHQHPPPPPPSHSLSSHQHHSQPPHHQSQLPPYAPAPYQQPQPSQYPRPHPHQQHAPSPSQHDEPPPPPPSSGPSPADHQKDSEYVPPSYSKIEEGSGWKYSLDVKQQPVRARMCGFGDKDRRPITPPPCVRLVIINTETGKEVDYNSLDHAMFVLSVDLWNHDGTKEVNLVRSSAGTGAMASSSTYTYSSLEPGTPSYQQQSLPPSRESGYGQSQGLNYGQDYPPPVQQSYGQAPSYPPSSSYGPPQQYYPRHSGYSAEPSAPPPGAPFRNGYGQDQNALTRMAVVGGQPQGMFTRNLIGSLAASAFRLEDTEGQSGIWFVLQDLSVRTEGTFRLRFSFVNVGRPGGQGTNVNQGRAPILSSCYSESFHVYSAKKFPGVCESTPLSKKFANQGIKIPIRKDANIKGEGDEEMYDQN
ncbi:hypothetical protein ACKRZS_010476 [Fusarium odoratissimum]|nr:uncharacterized protein FOIG_00471 [Fusarium odoratissimum NRRL 54006]EXM10294.1 hypothetical protein FOIG_00471 [Fusarium odoratissimum NRRL 54006]KAH7218210.1 velvet 2 [Fusarium oxysporum]KAK2137453.1 velvet 2 [Fusarium oxysporum II5]TXC04176.1 hypothetical protein FocTR4_00001684 [Fusarium oxysporum f. sp. cubense]